MSSTPNKTTNEPSTSSLSSVAAATTPSSSTTIINSSSNLDNNSSNNNNSSLRRSSSRSIKRKKFDDELVDSTATSYPKHNQKLLNFNNKSETTIDSSNNDLLNNLNNNNNNTNTNTPDVPEPEISNNVPTTVNEPTIVSNQIINQQPSTSSFLSSKKANKSSSSSSSLHLPSSSATTTSKSIQISIGDKNSGGSGGDKNNDQQQQQQQQQQQSIPLPKKKGRKPNSFTKLKSSSSSTTTTTKSLICENKCWKPQDDLALIINVEQTNDLKKVFDGVKFTNKFSYKDIESRWRSLLYNKVTRSISCAAQRQLHPEIIRTIKSKALFSDHEENLLKKIESTKIPILESLQELIEKNSEIFLPERTAKILLKHWCLLRHYRLLDDQILNPISKHPDVISFTEMESEVREEVLAELNNPDKSGQLSQQLLENINQEIPISIRKCILEIRMLENELPKYQMLAESVSTSDFDNETYAVLRGRSIRYLMRSFEITIGRSTKDYLVDVDLSLEGPATKISRKQAVINLQPTGEFILFNTGKHPIYIDSKPLLYNNSLQIFNESLIEFASLKFIFLINQDLITNMRNEILQQQNCKL